MENLQNEHVFVQMTNALKKFVALFKSTTEKIDGCWYDDAARRILFVLAFASVATAISYTFSNHIFFAWLGEPYSWIPAAGTSLVLEFAMVFIGVLFFQSLLSRETWFEIPALLTMVFMGFVFFVACQWGLKISNEGQGQLATIFAQKAAKKDTSFVNQDIDPRLADINAQLATIDGNITASTQAQNNAYSIRWKKKVTEDGARNAKIAGNNIGVFASTKDMLLAEKLKIESNQDSIQKAQRNFVTSTQTQWTSIFGGFMEWIKIFCIAAFGFCSAGVERHKNKNKGIIKAPTLTILDKNTEGVRRIGFAYGNKPKQELQPVATNISELQPVATDKKGVATDEEKEIILFMDSRIHEEGRKIQAWVNKLRNETGNKDTAKRNILNRLESINGIMNAYYKILPMLFFVGLVGFSSCGDPKQKFINFESEGKQITVSEPHRYEVLFSKDGKAVGKKSFRGYKEVVKYTKDWIGQGDGYNARITIDGKAAQYVDIGIKTKEKISYYIINQPIE